VTCARVEFPSRFARCMFRSRFARISFRSRFARSMFRSWSVPPEAPCCFLLSGGRCPYSVSTVLAKTAGVFWRFLIRFWIPVAEDLVLGAQSIKSPRRSTIR
jgi:hypothetical protein